MTPRSIETGRALSSLVSTATVADGATGVIAPGRGDRVALVVSMPFATSAVSVGSVAVGYLVGGTFAALTILSAGHPVCYLSVDKIGTALLPEISARNNTGAEVVLGITDVRQTQPLDDV